MSKIIIQFINYYYLLIVIKVPVTFSDTRCKEPWSNHQPTRLMVLFVYQLNS